MADDAKSPHEDRPESLTGPGQPAAILCVEDNVDNRILLRRVLQAEGYQVLEAGSAREALDVSGAHHLDLVLVDINMPAVDGLTLMQSLKSDARCTNVPVIAITANVMRGDQERTLAAGCDGYIQKPIDVDLLPRQILRFLRLRPQSGRSA